jgi:hypothetical protein
MRPPALPTDITKISHHLPRCSGMAKENGNSRGASVKLETVATGRPPASPALAQIDVGAANSR